MQQEKKRNKGRKRLLEGLESSQQQRIGVGFL